MTPLRHERQQRQLDRLDVAVGEALAGEAAEDDAVLGRARALLRQERVAQSVRLRLWRTRGRGGAESMSYDNIIMIHQKSPAS